MSRGRGFVYVMRSPAVTAVKIGLSERAPHLRAKSVGASGNYAAIGPWDVVDYREVEDMSLVEKTLHRHFQARHRAYGRTRELFDVPVDEAVAELREVSEARLACGDLIGRFRLERGLVAYLGALMRATGLGQFLDCQEMWTLSLYPSTSGGRLFTLNIDRHEVAFAHASDEGRTRFMLYLDPKVLRGLSVDLWLLRRRGRVHRRRLYRSARPGGGSMTWSCPLAEAPAVFALPFVRRALLAYWTDALLNLRDRGRRSAFARHHNHNAVQELLRLTGETT